MKVSRKRKSKEKKHGLSGAGQGVSRSASMVVAWLVARKGMEVEEAIEFLQSKRPAVSPNEVRERREGEKSDGRGACDAPPLLVAVVALLVTFVLFCGLFSLIDLSLFSLLSFSPSFLFFSSPCSCFYSLISLLNRLSSPSFFFPLGFSCPAAPVRGLSARSSPRVPLSTLPRALCFPASCPPLFFFFSPPIGRSRGLGPRPLGPSLGRLRSPLSRSRKRLAARTAREKK